MTRRIVLAIMVVAGAVVISFGLPLGVVIERQYRVEAVVKLERQATAAAIEVPASFASARDPIEVPAATDGAELAVYSLEGIRVAGNGPLRINPLARRSLSNVSVDGITGDHLVAAVPVTAGEKVIAVVRAAQPIDRLHHRVWRTWAAMAGLAAVLLALAWVLAAALARRLGRPVHQLVTSATVLGDGDFSTRAQRSGIEELDRAADALDATAARLGATLERERAFTSDASHQLRTPVTAMRMYLDRLVVPEASVDRGHLAHVVRELDRLEETIEALIGLARDVGPPRTEVSLADALDAAGERWRSRLAEDDRRLTIRAVDGTDASVRVSPAALGQILDVLLDNARRHGRGRVTVRLREVGDGWAVDVSDEGIVTIDSAASIFARRSGDRAGHGIGLALARSLAEAEGARLVLTHPGPGATFTLLFARATPR